MRVIFCGTPEFACPSLQALQDDPAFEIIQVITQPDRPAGRGKKMTPPPVKILAEALGIPVVQPEDVNRYQRSDIRLQECDFLVLVAYGQILSDELLTWPKIAPINLHASLLPRWRGASPIQHAILAGDRETGVTIQRMAKKLDAGPILSQEKATVADRETAISLQEKLANTGAKLLVRTLHVMLSEVQRSRSTSHLETEQDESQVTYCKKLGRSMGEMDPSNMTAEEIDRHVRALVPWPGVRVRMRGKRGGEGEMKLIETSLEANKDAFELSCRENTSLYIVKLQSPGKSVMTGAEWGRGREVDVESF